MARKCRCCGIEVREHLDWCPLCSTRLVLPWRIRLIPWAVVALVLLTRVYVGAHNPLDVICGAALGLVIGGFLNLAFGVPAPVVPAHEASAASSSQ